MTALLGTISLAVLAVVAVGYPLMRGARLRATPVAQEQGQRAELEARRESLYAALKDLEFDHETGKLSAEDYTALRERYTVQAVAVLQQLDAMATEERPVAGEEDAAPDEKLAHELAALHGGESATAEPETKPASFEAEIEREVAALRQAMKARAPLSCPVCGRAGHPGDAFCAGCGSSRAEDNHRCPECGAEHVDGDRFCVACGTALTVAA